MSDMNLRRRLAQLKLTLKQERQQEIARAVEYKSHGNDRQAAYHSGLADGRNSILAELRNLTTEYPADRQPAEAVAE